MATRQHDSPPITVHQSTGTHKFTQRRRTAVTAQSEVEAAQIGHDSHGYHKDEIQEVTLPGTPDAGTFTLSFNSGSGPTQTTAPLNFDANAATVQAALEALTNIGAGNVTVTGLAYQDWSVQFIGTLAKTNFALMGGNGNNLTGGTSKQVLVVETQYGGNQSLAPVKGGHDDTGSHTRYVAEAPSMTTDASPKGSLIKSGTVTQPVAPPGGEENTRKIWRGHTFASRIKT